MEGFVAGEGLGKFALLGEFPGLILYPELRLAFGVSDVLFRLDYES